MKCPTPVAVKLAARSIGESIATWRKLYSITDAGQAFLAENRVETDALLSRMANADTPHRGRPPQVVRALENFKLAARMRLGGAPLSDEQAHAFAQILDNAAQQLERI